MRGFTIWTFHLLLLILQTITMIFHPSLQKSVTICFSTSFSIFKRNAELESWVHTSNSSLIIKVFIQEGWNSRDIEQARGSKADLRLCLEMRFSRRWTCGLWSSGLWCGTDFHVSRKNYEGYTFLGNIEKHETIVFKLRLLIPWQQRYPIEWSLTPWDT
jgi:hypothetical protein